MSLAILDGAPSRSCTGTGQGRSSRIRDKPEAERLDGCRRSRLHVQLGEDVANVR